MKKKAFLALLLIIILVAFFKSCCSISIKNSNITNAQWLADISFLEKELPKKHKDLFYKISQDEFNSKINNLKENINTLNSDDIIIELLNIVALVGDSHTEIVNYKSNNILPFNMYKFKDGYYLTEIDEKYKDLLGAKVLKINNVNIEDCINKVSKLFPYENESMINLKAPEYLQDPKIINYISNNKSDITKLVISKDNKDFEISTAPINSTNLKTSKLSDSIVNKPLYMQDNKNFWYKYLDKEKVLYCQFNVCLINTPNSGDIASIEKIIEENNVEKVIIDLRNNVGGTHISDKNQLVSSIKYNNKVNVKNKLFVIIGRNTFSSGLLYALDFKEQTNAIIYGEPTSGNPNGFGAINNLILPNSKLKITYSTKQFGNKDSKDTTLKPDVNIGIDINSYLKGIDPVFESILNAK